MSQQGDLDEDQQHLLAQFMLLYHQTQQLSSTEHHRLLSNKRPGTRLDCPTVPRVRKSVAQVSRELGKTYFRRSFRMSYATFCELFRILKADLIRLIDAKKEERSPNGPISPQVRLACGIRFFAGGDAYDIACMFGISHSSVFKSIDFVIDAVNECAVLKIEFPSDHEKQREIAAGFRKKSPNARIGRCVGCIDGLIIWTHKPSLAECDEIGVGQSKFFCGRKHKFGLNMQAICNDKKQFTDISISYGASTSDLLAFEVSAFRQKQLNTPGFLAEGLCLFGDNAYVNTPFMATPYPNVGDVSQSDEAKYKDGYNYYHSQIRIAIEGAFGLFTQRWGFLRKQAPQQYTMAKTISAVSAMARLHNFLIDVSEGECPRSHSEEDEWSLAVNGAVPFALREGVRVPLQLMDAGHHQDDDPTRQRRSRGQGCARLPREEIHDELAERFLTRPAHSRRR